MAPTHQESLFTFVRANWLVIMFIVGLIAHAVRMDHQLIENTRDIGEFKKQRILERVSLLENSIDHQARAQQRLEAKVDKMLMLLSKGREE